MFNRALSTTLQSFHTHCQDFFIGEGTRALKHAQRLQQVFAGRRVANTRVQAVNADSVLASIICISFALQVVLPQYYCCL